MSSTDRPTGTAGRPGLALIWIGVLLFVTGLARLILIAGDGHVLSMVLAGLQAVAGAAMAVVYSIERRRQQRFGIEDG